MHKTDNTILNETKYIAIWVVVLSVIMEVVFVILNKWNYTVLLGNLLGGGVITVNFLLMGYYIQRAVKNPSKAKNIVFLSQSLRTILLFVVIVAGVVLPIFSTAAVIIPVFFPRIAILFRPLWKGAE